MAEANDNQSDERMNKVRENFEKSLLKSAKIESRKIIKMEFNGPFEENPELELTYDLYSNGFVILTIPTYVEEDCKKNAKVMSSGCLPSELCPVGAISLKMQVGDLGGRPAGNGPGRVLVADGEIKILPNGRITITGIGKNGNFTKGTGWYGLYETTITYLGNKEAVLTKYPKFRDQEL